VKSHYDKKQSIVLYSEGGVHSAQAMFLLWMQGYRNVLMLKGGLNEWNADVLHPVITSTKTSGAMRDSLDEIKNMSLYFGGAANLHTPGNSIESNSGREREKVRDEC
jgi:3-mercaptopyruvate sulfurtransferase SseA